MSTNIRESAPSKRHEGFVDIRICGIGGNGCSGPMAE